MRGIHESKEKLLSPELSENIALQLAFTQYKYYREGKNITVFFPYSSRMFQV
jgi:glucose-6-phosphate isomerase